MNKKISLGVAVTVVIAFVAATFAVTISASQRIYNRLILNMQDRMASYALIDELDGIVQKNYYGSVSAESRNSNMLNGYVNSLGDSSSYYLSPDAYAAYLASMSGEVNGIGINAEPDSKSGYLTATSVIENSPAASAGIKKGDLISVIDGETVTRKNYSQMIESLNGSKLTSVKITYLHKNKAKTVSVMMGYSAKSVSCKLIGSSAACIRIDGFYANTSKQLKNILDLLPDEISSIVFDVRGTASGSIQYTADTLKLIVPMATEGRALATEIDKNGNETYYASNPDSLSDYKIAVLTDKETSCCGELFACDLRDFGMAEIVGEATKGNANVQKAFALSDGSGIILTVAKIKPYITETFDGTGIAPDIEVPSNGGTGEDDIQLGTAIHHLSN